MARRLLVLIAIAVVVVLASARPAEAVEYRPPVDAPVTDPFRAPEHRYGPGNRGVDYGTSPGQPVRAAAPGVVVFAGPVGLTKHVVVAHDDGVRTSYSFLDAIAVGRGQRVGHRSVVGTAGAALHFGARVGGDYIDPLTLLGGRPHLVDDEASAIRAAPAGCTPAAELTPPPPVERRLAVLVGGLGSATGDAAILAVDTAALGYEPADVVQFSYRSAGGPYARLDTHADLAAAGTQLASQVAALHRMHPRTPIDVFAHSQGGLVARAALARPAGLPGVATVVTLGTPHLGNRLASAGASLGLASTSVGQLAGGSAFLTSLPPAPPGITAVSVGAVTDLVVPVTSTRWLGAGHATVDLTGPPTLLDHGRMTGDPAVTRELALAIAGRPPTCRSPAATAAVAVVGTALEEAQRAVGEWARGRISAGGKQVVRR